MTGQKRTRRRVPAGVLLLAAAGLALLPAVRPELTRAIWTDVEYATGSLQAGMVSPPTGLSCGPAGLLRPVTYNWIAPSGGVTRTGYRWTAVGPSNSSGTLAATATSHTLSQGLLGIGSGTFTLWARGRGAWESTPVTGHYSVIGILGLTAVSSCSVP